MKLRDIFYRLQLAREKQVIARKKVQDIIDAQI